MKYLLLALFAVTLHSCKPHKQVDLILYNGKIYTVDSNFSVVSAIVIDQGKIIETGYDDITDTYQAKLKTDLQGAAVYPGLIDAHCHFYGYSTDQVKASLFGTKSFDQVIDTLVSYARTNTFNWILGRGWDQNDWDVKEFPDKVVLDSLFPDTPVLLMRIDGHAILVNQMVLDLAGITDKTKIEGGEIEVKNGKLTGILIDNAADSIKKFIPDFPVSLKAEALLTGQKNCFAVGLTTVADAGLGKEIIFLLDSLQQVGQLDMQIYAMISYDEQNKNYFFRHGKIKTDKLTVQSFKLYVDGALGSRGACLLEPYSDKPGHFGFMLNSIDFLKTAAEESYKYKFQLNAHCIGDSANRTMLKIFGNVLKGKNNNRWRIEHCQVISPDDFRLFYDYSIIPSVQPTHATSDMYWAESRLGRERIKTAYAYRQLLKQSGRIANGSDFPVESINPLLGFYAAISRTDRNGYPPGGFQIENALTREQALKGMTIWAAYSIFAENEKGSLEAGKNADLVILDKDIMTCPVNEIPVAKVKQTIISGKTVFNSW